MEGFWQFWSEWCSRCQSHPFGYVNSVIYIVKCQWYFLHPCLYPIEKALDCIGVVVNKDVDLNTANLNQPLNKRLHKTVSC